MMTSGDLSDGVDDNGGPGNSMQYVASNKKAKTVMCFNWVQAERILYVCMCEVSIKGEMQVSID